MDLTTMRNIRDALADGDGPDSSPDHYTVRVRHIAGHQAGAAIGEWWGCWPRYTAEHIADVLAREYGGTINQGPREITVVSGRGVGGRPPVGPLVSLRLPPPLMDRLDTRARAEGTTRSTLMRSGVELALVVERMPVYPRVELERVSIRLPKEQIAALDARKLELGTTRTALLRHGAELILDHTPSEEKPSWA